MYGGKLGEGILEEKFPDELAKIQAPTLIVWGDRDSIITKEDQLALAKEIKGSQLLIHEGAGHLLYWEDPALVAADLTAFLHIPDSESTGDLENDLLHEQIENLFAEKRLSTKNIKTYSDTEVRGNAAYNSLTLDKNDGWE